MAERHETPFDVMTLSDHAAINAGARTAESARQDHVSPGDQYAEGWNAACIYITGRIRAMKEEGDAG